MTELKGSFGTASSTLLQRDFDNAINSYTKFYMVRQICLLHVLGSDVGGVTWEGRLTALRLGLDRLQSTSLLHRR